MNAEGQLINDRQHQFKFDGSYEFSKGAFDRPEPRPVDALVLRACR